MNYIDLSKRIILNDQRDSILGSMYFPREQLLQDLQVSGKISYKVPGSLARFLQVNYQSSLQITCTILVRQETCKCKHVLWCI